MPDLGGGSKSQASILSTEAKVKSSTAMGEKRGLKALEAWCRRVTDGYKDVRVADMTSSWRDGLAFCALIHHFRPDLIDFDSLSKENILQNNRLAFSVAEKSLGIPALLDAEDMVKYREPDRLSIATYLSQFYQYFEGGENARLGISPLGKRTLNEKGSDKIFTGPPAKLASASESAPVGRRLDLCHVCKHRVFILERLIVDNQLYHRTCFKCCKCNSLLKPGAYVEGDQPDTYECAVCPKDEKKPEFPRSPSTVSSVSSEGDAPKSPVVINSLQRAKLTPFSERSSLKIATSSSIQRNNFLRSLSSDTISPDDQHKEDSSRSRHPFLHRSALSHEIVTSHDNHVNDTKSEKISYSLTQLNKNSVLQKQESAKDGAINNSLPNLKTYSIRKIEIPSAFAKAQAKRENANTQSQSEKNISDKRTFLKSDLPKELKPLSIDDGSSLTTEKDQESIRDVTTPEKIPLPSSDTLSSTHKSEPSSLHEVKHSTNFNSLEHDKHNNQTFDEEKVGNSFSGQKNRVPKWSIPLIQSPTYQLSSLRSNTTANSENNAVLNDSKVKTTSKYTFTPAKAILTPKISIASLEHEKVHETTQRKPLDSETNQKIVSCDKDVTDIQVEEQNQSNIDTSIAKQEKNGQEDVLGIEKLGTPFDDETNNASDLPVKSDIEETDKSVSTEQTEEHGADHEIEKPAELGSVCDVDSTTVNVQSNCTAEVKESRQDNSAIEDKPNLQAMKNEEVKSSEIDIEDKPKLQAMKNEEVISSEIDYPDDLNPFGDDDAGEEEAMGKSQDVNYPDLLNPFGDSEDDDADDYTKVSTLPLGSSTPSSKVTHNNYDESLNPFGTDEEDDDDNTSLKLAQNNSQHRSSFSSITSKSSTSEKHASSSVSRSTIKRPKKRPPPPPPPINASLSNATTKENEFPQKNPEKTASKYAIDSPLRSLSPARLTPSPRPHKKKAAPKPPVATPNSTVQDSSLECDSFQDSGVNSETSSLAGDVSSGSIKATKELNNKRLATMEIDEKIPASTDDTSTNKSAPPSLSTWKKKKRPAPPVPIPQKRTIKKIPLKEIMSEMEEIEEKQQELERHGIELEMMIRDRNEDEPTLEEEELIMQLFELVNQKNALFRRQAELMYLKRSQRLEEEQADLEYKIRCLMTKPASQKNPDDAQKEEELLQRLVDVVEQRNEIVESIEMDRKRKIMDDLITKASPMSPMFDSKMEEMEDLSIQEHMTHKQSQMYGKQGTVTHDVHEKKSEKHKQGEKTKKEKKKKAQTENAGESEDKKSKKNKKKSWF